MFKMDKLEKASYIVLRKCMALRKNERLLIVYDKNKKDIADILFKEALKITRNSDRIETKVAKENGEEPLKHIADKMSKTPRILIGILSLYFF